MNSAEEYAIPADVRLASQPERTSATDHQLAISAQQGDRDAFHQLLRRHYDTIHHLSYRLTGHAEDAEDITQNVCIALAGKLKSFRGEAKFRTWLYTVVVNSCRDHHRKQRLDLTKSLAYCELEAHERAVNAENARRVAWLYRQIGELKPDLRETALLVLAEGLDHAEVGQILGCAASTVSWRMMEIRKWLKARQEADRD